MMTLTGSSARFSLSKMYWSSAVETSIMSLILASLIGSVTNASSPGHVKSNPFSGWKGATVPKAFVL